MAGFDDTPNCNVDAALRAAEPLRYEANAGLAAVQTIRRNDTVREVIDIEPWQATPTRHRGTVTALTGPGFAIAVQTHMEVEAYAAAVYADADACQLVAVLNDDSGGIVGWRDHRVLLDLRPTPEWTLWTNGQGLGKQARFAETIEQGEAEIVRPSATEMLDLAQTFHAATAAKFKAGNRLQDGRQQLVYEEDIQASAGGAGTAAIPSEFLVGLRPFHGAERYEVRARLRFLVRGGELSIGYFLHRADEVRRLAFADVVAKVAEDLSSLPLIEGRPAAPPESRG
ncbi:MAG: DUF2303 family protein [Acidimicrobiales bacterium]